MKHPRFTQLAAVYAVLQCGRWLTLEDIEHLALSLFGKRAPQASASARIRDVRAKMGVPYEKRLKKHGRGLFEYRLKGAA